MKQINAKQRFPLICGTFVLIIVVLSILIGCCFFSDNDSKKIECVIGKIVEYDSLETDLVFVDNCDITNKPIIEMTSLRECLADDLVRDYEENHRFEFVDSGSYLKFKSNQEGLNIFEVELIVKNHHELYQLIEAEWVSEATNDIVVAYCDIMEDFSSVESEGESVYNVVVITTQENISTAQLKQLLTETGLKLKYRLCSSNRLWSSLSNEYSKRFF